MSGFAIPVKEIIVNDDAQVVLRSTANADYTDGDVTSGNGAGFQLEGFHAGYILGSSLNLLAAATRIRKETPTAAVAETAAFTIAADNGAKAGDVYRVLVESLDLTPVEFQNQPTEKVYQLSVDCADEVAVIAELVSRINADPFSQVTAYAGFNNADPAQDDSAKIVLVGKTASRKVNLYVGSYADPDQTTYIVTATKDAVGTTVYHTVEDTSAVTARAILPINNYEYLKNINWSKNFDLDRNPEWFPQKGVSYNSYYFEVVSTPVGSGSQEVPSLDPALQKSITGFKVWVKSGLTLDTNLNLLTGDVNT